MNARKEFESLVGVGVLGRGIVKCATITHSIDFGDTHREFNLPVGYTLEEYSEFLKSLDFEYDSGYGTQELFGFIWFADGTWAERGEYDGSEWWEYKHCPPISEKLEKRE